MSRPELGGDPRYASNALRTGRRKELAAIVEDWTLRHTKAEIAAAIGGRVPFGPVNTVADIFADPHAKARGLLASVEHPGSAREAWIADTPIRMTATPGAVRRRAPTAGEDTDALLAEAGLTTDEIVRLRKQGAVA
jgi:formyl-CoA transferase